MQQRLLAQHVLAARQQRLPDHVVVRPRRRRDDDRVEACRSPASAAASVNVAMPGTMPFTRASRSSCRSAAATTSAFGSAAKLRT